MMKKGVKQFISGVLVLIIVFSVAGCGGKTVAEMDKDHVYSYEDIELPKELDDVRGVFYQNDRIYVVGTKYEENSNTYLCSMNLDGTDGTSVQLLSGYEQQKAVEEETEEPDEPAAEGEGEIMPRAEVAVEAVTTDEAVEETVTEKVVTEDAAVEDSLLAENGVMEEYVPEEYIYAWLNQIVMDDNANFYGAYEIYRDYTNENGEYISESIQALVCWNEAGEKLWSTDMMEGIPEEDYFYANNILIDKDGILWVNGGQYLKAFNTQGKQIKQAKLEEEASGSLFMDRDGNIFVRTWNEDYTKQFRQDVDKNTLALGAKEDFPQNIYSYGISQEGTVYDFILSDSTSIYGYNYGDAQPVELMDTVDSDMYSGNLSNVRLINDTQFIALYHDPMDWSACIGLFTKVPPEEVKDKIAIVLACMYTDYDMRKRVVDFNKTNETYRIQIKDYQSYSTPEDYLAGYTQMNNDIIAGNIPDIMIVDSQMPIDSYIAKGLIADLNPLLENDPELNREDYLENILDTFSMDGKLYVMVPSFQVSTIVGKTSIVGERDGWTMQEFKEVMAAQPEGTNSFSETTKEGMLYTALMMTKDEYIDADTGACYFDSQGFVELLEFVNEFPTEIDYSTWEDNNYWLEMQSAYRENRTILLNRHFSTYHDFNRVEKGEFGEDITIVGFPTESRNGNAIIPSLQLALSAKSGSQEGAWEFIRYYLTDEYQENLDYQFPVKKTALEKLEQEAMERPYWEDEEGNKEYYDDTYWINDVEVIIDPMTAEEAAEFTEFLSSLTLVGAYDESMMEIVTEEAQAFFEGQKSAQEVADIIQSRMKIYVSESR